MSVGCAYCITGLHHCVVIVRKDGSCHVHAPFYDKVVMDKIIKAIQKENKNWKEEKKRPKA